MTWVLIFWHKVWNCWPERYGKFQSEIPSTSGAICEKLQGGALWPPPPAGRGGKLGVLRVREHPLNMEVHPLTAKSTPSKWKENLMKHHFKQISNKVMVFYVHIRHRGWGQVMSICVKQQQFIISLWTERPPVEKHPLAFRQFSTYASGARVMTTTHLLHIHYSLIFNICSIICLVHVNDIR